MLTYLLKSVLPFTLTFIIGAALGGFFNPLGMRTRESRIVRTELRAYGYGKGHSCEYMRFKRRELVAETKPLIILFKPDARLPPEFGRDKDSRSLFNISPRSALVRVTFGADGKIQAVEPFYEYILGVNRLPVEPAYKKAWDSVDKAARLIQFTPEMKDGVPVSVTKELEIYFLPE